MRGLRVTANPVRRLGVQPAPVRGLAIYLHPVRGLEHLCNSRRSSAVLEIDQLCQECWHYGIKIAPTENV